VTAFQPPAVIGFHQEMGMRPRLLGSIVMDLTYTLTQTNGSVRVDRVLHLTLPARLQPARPIVLRQFRREARRILFGLKNGVESAT
jgi:hypothetical protein